MGGSLTLERKSQALAPGVSKPTGSMQGASGDYLPLCGFLRMKLSEWKMEPREGERRFPDDIT